MISFTNSILTGCLSIILSFVMPVERPGPDSSPQNKPEVVWPGMQSTLRKKPLNYTLFYITRNKNINTVFYDANFKSKGVIDPENPVDIYFVNYAEDGKRRDLNYIENALAYGIKYEKSGNDRFYIWLKAFPHRQLIMEIQNDKPVVWCTIAGKKAMLTHIHVNARPPLYTHVNYVEIYGMADGQLISEKVLNK